MIKNKISENLKIWVSHNQIIWILQMKKFKLFNQLKIVLKKHKKP